MLDGSSLFCDTLQARYEEVATSYVATTATCSLYMTY